MKELMLFWLLLMTVPSAAQNDWHEALREWLTAEDIEDGYSEELLEELKAKRRSRK